MTGRSASSFGAINAALPSIRTVATMVYRSFDSKIGLGSRRATFDRDAEFELSLNICSRCAVSEVWRRIPRKGVSRLASGPWAVEAGRDGTRLLSGALATEGRTAIEASGSCRGVRNDVRRTR